MCIAFTRKKPGWFPRAIEICSCSLLTKGSILISSGQEKITLILINGNYVWPKGYCNLVRFMQKLLCLKQFIFVSRAARLTNKMGMGPWEII